jgi:serine/threonine protein kinase
LEATETMSLTAGTRIGPYEITSPLGEGGMGVVYRAHDMKLGRDVAIKALPDAFANDADRLQRFQREAQVLASLNHPNIAQIYGLEESDKTRCIVMELVEGETLQERLRRGAIPIDEALPIAKQIAEALEAAHERGIIHRDLKPGNVILTRDGRVKVLDFGLAKPFQEQHTMALSNSPTLIEGSIPGVILGTVAYMSPEQARGKETDRTTDVWAFGCVLYEMLTGGAAFDGETVAEILAEIFKTDPGWDRLPGNTPEAIRRLLRRCLQRDRKLRLQNIGDARIEIQDASDNPTYVTPQSSRNRQRLLLGLVAVLGVLLIVTSAVMVTHLRETPAQLSTAEFWISAPEGAAFPFGAGNPILSVSPDGQHIAFIATQIKTGQRMLWIRDLNSTNVRPLPGTEGMAFSSPPFWSPDSRFLAFVAGGKLKKIPTSGGSTSILCDVPVGGPGTWNSQGIIILAQGGRLIRVNSNDGKIAGVAVNKDSADEIDTAPTFLPDQTHFLYIARSVSDLQSWRILVGSVTSNESKVVGTSEAETAYSQGYLLFVRSGSLVAQRFDPDRLVFSGDESPIDSKVNYDNTTGLASFSVSSSGLLAFGKINRAITELTWFDRKGSKLGQFGPVGEYGDVALSRDGNYVVVDRQQNAPEHNRDLWLLDLQRRTETRLTFDPRDDSDAVWSPDSKTIAFAANSPGGGVIYTRPANGGGSEEQLAALPGKSPGYTRDWSFDGRFILFSVAQNGLDIWAVPTTGERKPFPVLQSPFNEVEARLSPNGKWIAYQSDESRTQQVYVQPFPPASSKWSISTTGGKQPRWRADGKELFYVGDDNFMMAVPIISDTPFQAGIPQALFHTSLESFGGSGGLEHYAVSADGQKFLMNVPAGVEAPPITVVVNWKPKP